MTPPDFRRVVRRLVIGFVILSLAVVAAFYRSEQLRRERVRQLNEINAVQCKALDRIYRQNRTVIARGDLRLDASSYYKDHPDELARAHAENLALIKLYESPACPTYKVS